jgi:sulfide:quinone oxidoreductase
MVANNLRKKLSPKQWDITIIDNDEIHHYQPGWLFIPFASTRRKIAKNPSGNLSPMGLILFSMMWHRAFQPA